MFDLSVFSVDKDAECNLCNKQMRVPQWSGPLLPGGVALSMGAARSNDLSPTILLMPLVGSLRYQAAEIVSILGFKTGSKGLFCDPFFGSGAISYAAKKRGFTVWANDLAKRSYVPAKALILNGEHILADTVRRA